MSEPRRLLDGETGELGRALLSAAREDAPPDAFVQRTLVAVGAGAAVLSAASAAAGIAGGAGASVAEAAPAGGVGLLVAKWLGIGAAAGLVSVGTVDGITRLVGTGAYRVVDVSPGRMALEAVSTHWAGAPRTERIVFLEVGSEEHADAEFAAGALDVWFPPGPPRRLEGALSIPGLHVGYLAFQTEKEPFANRKLRQAVAAALDPATLGAALGNTAVPLQSFLPPGAWARREGSPVLGGTRDQVKALLRDGGWPQGATPVLLVPGDVSGIDASKLAQAMTQMLGGADIPVRVKIEPSRMVRAALESGAHELALAEAAVVGGDPHLFLFPLSTSEGARPGPKALNFSFYRNPRLDDVLIRASQLSSRHERRRLYHRGQALLAADMPWLPIYVRLLWGVARPNVRDLRLHPTGFHRLTTVFLTQ